MALLVVASFLWQILNYNLFQGWHPLPVQSFQTIVPLILLGMVWIGRPWARYALAAFSLFVVVSNVSIIQQLKQIAANGLYRDLAMVVFILAGHSAIVFLALFSRRITELLDYRRDAEEPGMLSRQNSER